MIILHIDKEKPVEEFINDFNKSMGVDYLHTGNVDEAINILNDVNVDIILVGESANGKNSEDFVKMLADTSHNSIPTVCLVDSKSNHSEDYYLSLGFIDSIKRSELTKQKISDYLCYIIDQAVLISDMKSLNIAIIDDSKLSQNIISSYLNEKKIYNITSYTDPRELIKSNKSYDVYFIDMIMPKVTGDKLAGIVRKRSPQSIIIVMSSIDNVKTISNVLSAGADDYIIKPFNKDIFLARLKTNYRSYKLVKQLDKISKTDSLTGAFNHGFIFSKLSEEINSASFKGSDLSVLLLDLDNFKKINDKFGHHGGDRVLVHLSDIFRGSCRKADYFGRYGGEEFIFIMAHTNLDSALKFTNRLKNTFSGTSIDPIDQKVTFSGGLVMWDGKESGEDLVKRADDLLYLAKRSGRNQIKY